MRYVTAQAILNHYSDAQMWTNHRCCSDHHYLYDCKCRLPKWIRIPSHPKITMKAIRERYKIGPNL